MALLDAAVRFCAVTIVLSASLSPASFSPASAETPKWGAHLDFEGRWGNSRALGDAGLFAPLWQNQTSLFFADVRGKFDSQDGREGNFGLGYRHMLSNGWNVGVYGYYDVRRSSLGNMFNQATLGAEMLSADWDVRANVYAPFGSRSREIGTTGGNPFADFANGTVQIVTPGRNQILERALTGLDGEVGWRAPVFDVDALTQVRLYGGGFYFDGGGLTRDIAGPRGRIEFSLDGVAGFSSARLTLGAEVQHDDLRGTQGFAIARLRVPLHAEKSAPRLSAQERRMTERVVRDVDIVSGTGKGTQAKAEVREDAINTWNNKTVTDVVQVSATTQVALQTTLANHGAGSVVILNGVITGVTATTAVGGGQTLLGGGAVLALRGASTGTAVNFLAPGAGGNLTGAVANNGVVALSSGSVVGGLTIGTGTALSSHAIHALNAPGAVAFGNTITTAGNGGFGVYFSSSANGTASGNTIATTGTGANGVYFSGSNDGTVSGNTVTTAGFSARGVYFVGPSSNGTVSGNTITTADGDGVYFSGSSGTASGNTITTAEGRIGVAFSSSANSIASGNTITTAGGFGYGVYFSNSANGAASGNTIATTGGFGYGVYFSNSANGAAGGNTIATTGGSGYGVYFSGSSPSGTASGNTVTTAGLSANAVYFSGSNNSIVSGNTLATKGENAHSVLFENSAFGTVSGNAITTEGTGAHGVAFSGSANSKASGNAIATEGNNTVGVGFFNSASSTASGNTITTAGLSAYGVYFSGSNDGTASGNTIMTTGATAHGVYASGSNTLTVSTNTFHVTLGKTIYAQASSFDSTTSTGNIDPRAGPNRCGNGGGASGRVSFTTAPNCF